MDMLRFDRWTAGRYWVDDYGYPSKESDFKVLRAERDWSQQELADIVGVHRTAISRWAEEAQAVLERVGKGDRLIPNMVRVIYAATDPRLHGAAALSVLAHLEDLVEKGLVATDGPARLLGVYRIA